MAVDKNKVTAEAAKLVQKGSFDKAIKAYEKILAEDPKDVRVLLKVGELHQKKGDSGPAASAFGRAAEAYAEQGFFLKSVAVYKQMMKLTPDDVRVNERLAGLYQQLGILSDAMAQLQLIAQGAEKAGDGAKLLEVLRRMVDLDPDNAASAVKLGELYAKTGQPKLALDQFRRAAEGLKRTNRSDEYLKVAERIALLDANDVGLLRELAHAHLAKGDTKRALARLQLCFKLDPKDVETLTLLAQAFNDLGQVSKTVSVYKELAHLHAERGRADQARATWRRVAELAPDDSDAAQALAGGRKPSAPAAPSAAPPRAPAPAPAAPVAARPPPVPRPAPPTAASPVPPRASAPPPGADAIPKLLTETDVYVKYGLHEKALEHLAKVFAIDPDHLDAREKARDLRAVRNDAAGATEEAARAVRIARLRGLADRAAAALARLREIAPTHPELATAGPEVVTAPVVLEEAEELVEVEGEELVLEVDAAGDGDDLALEAAGAAVEDEVEEDGPPARPSPPVMVATAPQKPPPAPPTIAPPMVAPLAAAARAPAGAGARVPAPPAPPPRVPPPVVAAPVAPPPIVVAPAAPPRAAPASPVRPPPPSTPDADEEDDLADELQEADFLIEQGLLDDAREALTALATFHPRHAKLAAKLAALAQREAAPAAPPPEAQAAPAAEDDGFDIARELAEELGATPSSSNDEFQYSVEDVFSQFKRGIAETVKPEDADTHYDLGIAYKEMGLLDDAVHEFEVALSGKGRKKEVDCLTMIGLCRMERGDGLGAVEAFRRAMRSDYLTPEAARAVHYELGAAYAAAGDGESALHYLHKVLKVDPRFRDAKAFVARLGGGPGRPPPGDDPAARPAAAAPAPDRGPKKNIGYV
jgi:tetratricopeptide (TPR) repeat protein